MSMKLGAHVSTAGGVSRAPANAAEIGAECFQLFTRNQRRWSSPEIPAKEAELFRGEVAKRALGPVLSHASYLVNLASPAPDLAARSRAAVIDELRRGALLGVDWLVLHPGAHRGDGAAAGVTRVAENLDRCLDSAGATGPRIALETTAGSGSSLGGRLEELRDILAAARCSARLGVCLDTCHLHVAGYGLVTDAEYEDLKRRIDEVCGLDTVACWHLNDSRGARGSRRDRHAPVGEGSIGLDALRRIAQDERWAALGGCLETPGGPEAWREELRALRTP